MIDLELTDEQRVLEQSVREWGAREMHKLMQADYLLGYRTDRPTRCELPAYGRAVKAG